ncbi:MAG: fumarate hydratase C-terminal domain-containing protein [Chloroflexi bacterium]|nr:fumarate hydratase C-terminal domain-containing protein [Chloroflexota bacterium]
MELTLPLTDAAIEGLRAGDRVALTGVIYTARDAAHLRMVAAIRAGAPLPFDLRGQVIYYVGPTPARPGQVIGSAGPTTSVRMDATTVPLLEQGLKGIIGKGNRGTEVRAALQQHRAVYFMAPGGIGALLSQYIRSVEVVAYEDLGTEAVRRLTIEGFPVIVANDVSGGDLFEQGKARYRIAGPAQP